MVHNHTGDADSYVRGGLHSPGSDRSSDLDDGSLVHPALNYRLQAICWLDTHSGDPDWTDAADWKFVPPTEVWSVGFVVNTNEKCIELVQCIGITGDNEQRFHSVTIPIVCILKSKTLSIPYEKSLTPDK